MALIYNSHIDNSKTVEDELTKVFEASVELPHFPVEDLGAHLIVICSESKFSFFFLTTSAR
jgi:hypothetical protein